MNPSRILHAREQRQSRIRDLLDGCGIILIKANIPGEDKNIYLSSLLVSLFFEEVKRRLAIGSAFFYESEDGPYYIIQTKKDILVKDDLISIEENHQLGRYIDLDFFLNDDHSVSRSDQNLARRTCVLCGGEVISCMRKNTHTVEDVLEKIAIDVRRYLENWVEEAVMESIFAELNLEHKFGLVTPTSQGSHPDMDYALMKRAATVICPYLVQMFFCGYDSYTLNEAYLDAKRVGILAEEGMFHKLLGINAYKGLIFILGFALVSTGFALKHNQPKEDCFNNIAKMASTILEDVPTDTFGGKAYHKYGFGGARKEASLGLPSVRKALEICENEEFVSLHRLLITLVGLSEDSVLLKRAKSIESYEYFKMKIGSVDPNNDDEIVKVTNECITKEISIGGAADLLVTTVYMKLFMNNFIPNL